MTQIRVSRNLRHLRHLRKYSSHQTYGRHVQRTCFARYPPLGQNLRVSETLRFYLHRFSVVAFAICDCEQITQREFRIYATPASPKLLTLNPCRRNALDEGALQKQKQDEHGNRNQREVGHDLAPGHI